MEKGTGDCALYTCPVPGGFFSSPAAPGGDAFMLAAFATLIPVNLYTGIRHKTPLYASLVIAGLILEVVGHVGKILLRDDVASETYFSVYMMGTLCGPTLISAAIYLILPHVMVIYGSQFSLISHPIYCVIFFLLFDILTLVFQIAGVAFAANGAAATEMAQGVKVVVLGCVIQVCSLLLFLSFYWYFQWKLSRRWYNLDVKYASIYDSQRFKLFLLATQVTVAFLLLRAAVRIATFASGLASSIAQSSIVSLLADDTLVLLACIILSILPAGSAFGSPAWEGTSPFAPSTNLRDDLLPLRTAGSRSPLQFKFKFGKKSHADKVKEWNVRRAISNPFPSQYQQPQQQPAMPIPKPPAQTFYPLSPSPYLSASRTPAHAPQQPQQAYVRHGRSYSKPRIDPPLISPPLPTPFPQGPQGRQRPPYEISPVQVVPYMPGLPAAAGGGGLLTPRHKKDRSVDRQLVTSDLIW
ncbi:RTA1 like protein-domain-containing protein [Diplogelasinospora grovesii]|uniref:RTA1 like protein-domain-containing protein n=1 Tax=Diplogelasinospora grovesii TaxID=303347 RepID=A0AAN6N2H2_9PEZI|nr:RTA1 like protein-domain-containing protein [Diplogelasinospora grovesii]